LQSWRIGTGSECIAARVVGHRRGQEGVAHFRDVKRLVREPNPDDRRSWRIRLTPEERRPHQTVVIDRHFAETSMCHRSADHAWSDLVETMGIEPTTPCLQIQKMAISASFGSYRIVSDYAI
jgi:hypothetical protein